MTTKIKQLSKEVYDLIAAGEVVLAPVSAAKELVENALDAGASRIIVEIASGGIERIRVLDNGTGIAPAEVALAFAPHATSKLHEVGDLERIETLGFRGEALASIAAVAQVTMVTRTAENETGTRVRAAGNAPLTHTSAGADIGTDITVEELFFNIPARRKHLGSARAEGGKIVDYLSKAAVSRPDTAFRLIADGALVFATLGKGDRLAAIAAVYGAKTAESLVYMKADASEGGDAGAAEACMGQRIEGYIAGPLGMRGNRKGQHFFVNGRAVTNAILDGAVSRAYREFAEPGRFPVLFLFLTLNPRDVDVNVHPAKSEISFTDPQGVAAFVEASLTETLRSARSIPALKTHASVSQAASPFQLAEEKAVSVNPEAETLVSTYGGDGRRILDIDVKHLLSTKSEPASVVVHYVDAEGLVDDNKLRSIDLRETFSGVSTDDRYPASLDIAGLRPLTTLFATYILATDGAEIFYIIDQHAAHERVNFERFLRAFQQREIAFQALLTPYLFTFPATLRAPEKFVDFFLKIGYEIDEFGENTWAARTFPAFISYEEAASFLLECLAALDDEAFETTSFAAIERIMARACKASVKANTVLSDAESSGLLADLSRCANPFTCPHGRPVFLKLTRTDIERMFKRI